jgi:hypothetical protein
MLRPIISAVVLGLASILPLHASLDGGGGCNGADLGDGLNGDCSLSPSAVPLPAPAALIGIGLAGLLLARRKR